MAWRCLPWPQVELPYEEIPHHSFHVAKTSIEGDSVVCEGLDKATLVFLAEQAQDECFLTRLDYPVSSVHQDTCEETTVERAERSWNQRSWSLLLVSIRSFTACLLRPCSGTGRHWFWWGGRSSGHTDVNPCPRGPYDQRDKYVECLGYRVISASGGRNEPEEED